MVTQFQLYRKQQAQAGVKKTPGVKRTKAETLVNNFGATQMKIAALDLQAFSTEDRDMITETLTSLKNSLEETLAGATNPSNIARLLKRKGSMNMNSQIELNQERLRLRDKFGKALPSLMKAEQVVLDEVYKDGALPAKIKRLMAMCVALGVGCTNCILGQTTAAIDKGATKEEILEALSVLLAIRGTTGMAESLRVIKLLEEKGMV